MFSFVSWPFSLKILWAPLVDSCYLRAVGQRRTWLIPVQVRAPPFPSPALSPTSRLRALSGYSCCSWVPRCKRFWTGKAASLMFAR